MTAADFTAWVAHMRAARGWSDMECSRQLGCGENQIRAWKAKGAPHYIALACAALARRTPLKPWTAGE